jgi:xanthine dehydrogenase accessory factor
MNAFPDWPLFGMTDEIRPALAEARATGQAAALATIIDLDGGGPRPVGTQMVLTATGASGFLSGGCLEGDIALHAQAVVENGAPKRLIYGRGSPWPDIRLLCGARIEILLERIAPDDAAVATLLALWEARRPAHWASDGQTRACSEHPQSGLFSKRFDPTWKLVVVGSDPTALAIAALGAQGGFATTLVRPRGPLQGPPLAGVAYSPRAAAEAFADIGLDAWTAVAVATHEAENDHAALLEALPSAAGYVGVLGARRRIAERLTALRAAGVAEASIARLRAPIGLPVGGKAPWEVAVSAIAEIMAERVAASGKVSVDRSESPQA